MKIAIALIVSLITINLCFSQTYYNVTPGNGYGLRFWSADDYKIHMGAGTEYQFGPVTDYSIKTNMSNDAGRGWTWGVHTLPPVAAINTLGDMQIAGVFKSSKIGIGTSPASTELLAVKSNADGNNVASFNGPNSGITIQPNTSSVDLVGYTAASGYKSIFLRSGANGLLINPSGNVGIGTTSPQARLDVYSLAELGSATGNFVLLNRFYSPGGSGGNYYFDNTWLYRDAPGSDWITARLHKGISIDGSYTTPGVSTRTWWERDPFNNIQSWGDANQTYLTINQGNVGIGTISPDAKLAVKGTVHAQEVKVDLSVPGPDYVFEENYNLPSLTETENYIKENKHLPEMPSAKEMETNGINLSEMNMLLLKKVEELTLHLIEKEKQIVKLERRITQLEKNK